MRLLKNWLALGALVVLGACGGGGGDAGDPILGGGGDDEQTATVAKLDIVLTNSTGTVAASLPNNGTDRITATVTAVNDANAVVADAELVFSVDNALVSPNATATDADGVITAEVGIGSNSANRVVTVRVATADGKVSNTATFLVIGAELSVTAPPVVVPGAEVTLTYVLEDASSNPLADQSIVLNGGGVDIPDGKTGLDGKYTVSFDAPSSEGAFTVTATAAGDTLETIIQVQTSSVPNATGTVTSASVSVNPSVVSVNASSATENSTTVRALFKGTKGGSDNAAISNVRVRFTLPDENSVGGRFGNTGVVYSDSTGYATTSYIPGAVSSPAEGVTVRACWSKVDFAAPVDGECPATASDGSAVGVVDATLTVVDEALRISIGTDEFVQEGNVTYFKDYVVVVVDAANRAKADVEITPKLDLPAFYKGAFSWDGGVWAQTITAGACLNEDENRNGSEEDGEDNNGNGELDPAGVTITMVGSSKTDSSGKAIVRIEYPRDRAAWIDYVITVTGKVGGSEGLAVYKGLLSGLGNLPYPADAVDSEDEVPAFVVSPYGRLAGCDNAD